MAQFKLNDVVVYGSNGVCRVDAIELREHGDYYILRPVHKNRTKFMVPVDNEHLTSRMRPIPTKASLTEAVAKVKNAAATWISDSVARKEYAKGVLDHGSAFDLLMLERSFFDHKQHNVEIGKKSTLSDSIILRSVQDHIRDEFSVVFGIDPDDVPAYIDKLA